MGLYFTHLDLIFGVRLISVCISSLLLSYVNSDQLFDPFDPHPFEKGNYENKADNTVEEQMPHKCQQWDLATPQASPSQHISRDLRGTPGLQRLGSSEGQGPGMECGCLNVKHY